MATMKAPSDSLRQHPAGANQIVLIGADEESGILTLDADALVADGGYDPITQAPFTRVGAWEAVKNQLQSGCALTAIELDIPKGKIGYWFHFHDARGTRIYVKLQIGSGVVFGRSFHEG